MMKTIKGLIMGIQFFTSIPIPYAVPMDRDHIERAVRTMPILGLLQGAFYAGLLYILLHWTPFSPLAAAFFVWLAMILVTGGIHLDGWMDTSDAFFSYRDKDKRLEIMKDPRMGAFGVLSVIVLLSTRFLFIYESILHAVDTVYVLIMLIPFLSKSVAGVLLIKVRAAKEDGLGTMFKKAAGRYTLWFYPLYIAIVLAVLWLLQPQVLGGAAILVLMAGLFILFAARKAVKWFGGITGDVIGASIEGVEITLWLTLWLWLYIVTG
ncbi:adenosylcobinamide-GDP ribazoletransferase [Bacillus benzoevorans]|uniref:Adenosylcobinamide-GDP ribazoletransferase n=2 Tax=Bacillus benzoevorans TaxID=1456 RepID=A0A7X0LYQ7_9BACI|nr:adenosylcobinamide-GDP ribazoletransferase [Bacillus benzoevorans]